MSQEYHELQDPVNGDAGSGRAGSNAEQTLDADESYDEEHNTEDDEQYDELDHSDEDIEIPAKILKNKGLLLAWNGELDEARELIEQAMKQIETTKPFENALAAYWHGPGMRRETLLPEHMRGLFNALEAMENLQSIKGEGVQEDLREFRTEVERFYQVRRLDPVGPLEERTLDMAVCILWR
ncbi:hypothetical protein QBC36DRAFT_315531 [Triangularia setosa]|uniref:Uncharacterized protein n=1 Tax=Triangularia setosa TaxID=2587417 RepID=A0AAN6VZN7_9PEZI|nr:hypothetical protein QBC36DRAFT_315531 [Podospora setosa]